MNTGLWSNRLSIEYISFYDLLSRSSKGVLYTSIIDELLPNIDVIALLHLNVKFLDKGVINCRRAKDEVTCSVYAGMVKQELLELRDCLSIVKDVYFIKHNTLQRNRVV